MLSSRWGRPSRCRSCSTRAPERYSRGTTTPPRMRQDPVLRKKLPVAFSMPSLRGASPFMRLLYLSGLIWCAFYPVGAHAQPSKTELVSSSRATPAVLDVTLAATRSDNVRRTANDEESDTLAK